MFGKGGRSGATRFMEGVKMGAAFLAFVFGWSIWNEKFLADMRRQRAEEIQRSFEGKES